MNYRLTRRAKADIVSIYNYTVDNFGHVQADVYLGGLDAVFEILCDQPKLGREIAPVRHRHIHRQHAILYRVKDDQIIIVRIWNLLRPLPKAWA